jgi:biopolymer transport protein TolQ
MSIVEIILHASFVVQFVMLLLLAGSLASWAVIFRKRTLLRQATVEAERFENNFWSGGDINALHKAIEARGKNVSGMEGIFEAGYREFNRQRQHAASPIAQVLEGSQRGMRVAQLREMDRLEHNLAMLATVGSISPYVGLFGTVWGIMSAFHALGDVQQATLAMVAPGIAEALVATAMGLFAAIPAVIAYNRYADQVARLEVRYDVFMEEFSTILQRYAAARSA